MNARQRNNALDLLRALAIVLVVNSHIVLHYARSNPLLFLSLGKVGVDLFFLLSGWLLGRQLCEEFRRECKINIRRFWCRRWLRTLPAYGVVLLGTAGQAWIQGKLRWNALSYLVFIQNYTGLTFYIISWSLCVEEYFYLAVAPLLLFMLRRPSWGVPLAAILLVLPALCRAEGWYGNLRMTHVRYDQCAVGVFLAWLSVFAPRVWLWLRRSLVVLMPLALILAGAAFLGKARPDLGIRPSGIEEWTLICAVLVIWASNDPTYANIPGSGYIAKRAYSLYLIHSEGIAAADRLPDIGLIPFAILIWAISLVLAELLYRFVERPGMRLRERFASTRSLDGAITEKADKEPAFLLAGVNDGSKPFV